MPLLGTEFAKLKVDVEVCVVSKHAVAFYVRYEHSALVHGDAVRAFKPRWSCRKQLKLIAEPKELHAGITAIGHIHISTRGMGTQRDTLGTR